VYRRVPELGAGALAEDSPVPGEAIICTWTTNLALATDAVQRGVQLRRGAAVTDVLPRTEATDYTTLVTTAGDICGPLDHQRCWPWAPTTSTPSSATTDSPSTRAAVNCWSSTKLTRPMVPCIVLAVPSSRGKGVLVSPTIYGNVMRRTDLRRPPGPRRYGTSEAGFEFLFGKGRALMPTLFDEEITATYAGLRAAINHGDYLIDVDTTQHYVLVGWYSPPPA